MKNQLFTIVALGALSLGAFRSSGQGNVVFANQTTTEITNAAGAKLVAPAGTYMFGLYLGPLGSPPGALTLVATGLNPNWPPGSIVDGWFDAGNPFTLPNGYPAGTTIAFQVRLWEAALGNSYEAAISSPGVNIFGESILGYVTPTVPPNPAAPLFGNTGGGLVPAFAVGVVPEPSTFVLGSVGLAVLVFCSRRRTGNQKTAAISKGGGFENL